jgi:hypothetical protein
MVVTGVRTHLSATESCETLPHRGKGFAHKGGSGLLHKGVHARAQRVSRQEDKLSAEQLVVARHLLVEARSIELGHPQVTQNYVVGPLPELLKRDGPIRHRVDLVALQG